VKETFSDSGELYDSQSVNTMVKRGAGKESMETVESYECLRSDRDIKVYNGDITVCELYSCAGHGSTPPFRYDHPPKRDLWG